MDSYRSQRLFSSISSRRNANAFPTTVLSLIYKGIAYPNSVLLPSLLFKINESQLALEATILKLSNWVEARGSAEVADNLRGALDTIDKNEEFIKMTLVVMMSPE